MKLKTKISSVFMTTLFAASALTAFPVSAYDYPDPDGDGSISINDTIVIRTYLSGINEPTDLAALDFDENGVISEMDALTVQLYLSGMWRSENDN